MRHYNQKIAKQKPPQSRHCLQALSKRFLFAKLMEAQQLDINRIDETISLLTFGYIREYISNIHYGIEIPNNIILLCACFANICINSKILVNYSEIQTFIQLISNELADKNVTKGNLELIYQSSRDGQHGNYFWDKCKFMKDTVILIQNNNNHKFGCYLSIGPCNDDDGDTETDHKCFIYGIKPKEIVYKHNKKNHFTIFYGGMLRTLWLGDYGGAINISQSFTKPQSCESDQKCETFIDLNCKQLVGGKDDNGIYSWNIVEMEVFKLKQN